MAIIFILPAILLAVIAVAFAINTVGTLMTIKFDTSVPRQYHKSSN